MKRRVELIQLNARGKVAKVIAASTLNRAGRFEFNLTRLGISPASNLLIRASDPVTGGKMRAFVVGKATHVDYLNGGRTFTSIDINTVSETTVRLILERLARTPKPTLTNLTVKEVSDVQGAIALFARLNGVWALRRNEASVKMLQGLVLKQDALRGLLAAVVRAGETAYGLVDIGTYFPITKGAVWTYVGTNNSALPRDRRYEKIITSGGIKQVEGETATVFSVTRSDRTEASTGTSKPVPFTRIPFPPVADTTFQQLHDLPIVFEDIDHDGRPEPATFHSQAAILPPKTVVAVPAGRFFNVLVVKTDVTIDIALSSNRGRLELEATYKEWLAPRVGVIQSAREIFVNSAPPGNFFAHTSEFEQLTNVTGLKDDLSNDLLQIRQVELPTNDIIYDKVSDRLYGSTPHRAAAIIDSVVKLNPKNARVENAIAIGPEPGPLAMAADGSTLYVGLDRDASIRTVDVLHQNAGESFTLDQLRRSTRVLGNFMLGRSKFHQMTHQ